MSANDPIVEALELPNGARFYRIETAFFIDLGGALRPLGSFALPRDRKKPLPVESRWVARAGAISF